jgi:hypothetical protein
VSVDAIFTEVLASLERHTTRVSKRSYGERLATGWRGAQKLDIECHISQTSSGLHQEWHVTADVEGCPPLLFYLNRRGSSDAEAAARGSIVVVPTGDADFDGAWTIEGAPRATVAKVFAPAVRDAVAGLGAKNKNIGAYEAIDGDGVLHAAGGRVEVSARGPFDAELVLLGIDLVVAVCKEITAIADLRRQSPPAPATVAAEEAEVKAALATHPSETEWRWWRRLSTRTQVLIIVAAVILGIAVLVNWVHDTLAALR